jgi:hypothetical protein
MVFTDGEPLYWESDDNEEIENEPTPTPTPTPQSPMRKITTRHVGNTQRRRFR